MKRKCGTNLHQEDDEKVEVGDSSELFKQVLWQKVPDSVLQRGQEDREHEKLTEK